MNDKETGRIIVTSSPWGIIDFFSEEARKFHQVMDEREEVYEIQSPLTDHKSYHDAVEEVAYDIVEGLRCPGCEVVIVGEGTKCFCKDELTDVLAAAHYKLRWHSEDCLHENHEDPTMERSYPALLEEADDV